mgnify:CR=1 FL=1
MHALIDALTALIENPEAFKGQRPATPRTIQVDLADAPPCVQRLARALAERYYNVDLGELSMFDNDDTSMVQSLAGTLAMAAENGELDLPSVLPDGFAPERTLQLGADGGGMSYFGVSWKDGATSFVVVELEDPTEDNLLRSFDTPAAWLEFLTDRLDGDAPADLDALRAATS